MNSKKKTEKLERLRNTINAKVFRNNDIGGFSGIRNLVKCFDANSPCTDNKKKLDSAPRLSSGVTKSRRSPI